MPKNLDISKLFGSLLIMISWAFWWTHQSVFDCCVNGNGSRWHRGFVSAPPSVSSLAKDNGVCFRWKSRFRFIEKVVGELLLRRRPLYPTELRRQIRKRCAVREKTLHSTRPFLIIATLSLLCQSISFCFSFMKYVRNVGFHSTQILHVMQAFA